MNWLVLIGIRNRPMFTQEHYQVPIAINVVFFHFSFLTEKVSFSFSYLQTVKEATQSVIFKKQT